MPSFLRTHAPPPANALPPANVAASGARVAESVRGPCARDRAYPCAGSDVLQVAYKKLEDAL